LSLRLIEKGLWTIIHFHQLNSAVVINLYPY
jgi:hypothetical protein